MSCIGRTSFLGLLGRYGIKGLGPDGGPLTPFVGGGPEGPDVAEFGVGPL